MIFMISPTVLIKLVIYHTKELWKFQIYFEICARVVEISVKQAGAELCQAQRGLKGCCEITSTFYIQFRQSFAKETFSYDEHLKS